MKPRLLGVCVLIAFVAMALMGPPDVIGQIQWGIYSAILCAALVTESQVLLSRIRKSDRTILTASILATIVSVLATFLALYILRRLPA